MLTVQDGTEIDINRLTLSFNDPVLEGSFLSEHFNDSVEHIRFMVLIGVLVYCTFYFIDYFNYPAVSDLSLLLRFGLIAPFGAAIFAASFYSSFKAYYQPAISLLMSLSIIVLAFLALSLTEYQNPHFAGMLILLMVTYSFARLHYKWASVSGLAALLVLLLLILFMSKLPFTAMMNEFFFILAANMIGIFTAYSLEYRERKSYYLNAIVAQQHEKLEEANKLLEHRVEQRTTELQLANQQLVAAKENLEKSAALKTEIFAQISHEIRTPLNAIVGLTHMVVEELPCQEGEDFTLIADKITKASNRLIRTIDLTLFMSELQSGTYKYQPATFDLFDDLIITLLPRYSQWAKEKNLLWDIQAENGPFPLKADLNSVRQIIHNLMENALAYTFEGSVQLSLKKDDEQNIEVRVKDTGIGISQEYLPDLFEPFSQEDQGFSRRFEGTGLGLALVKKYCELNDAHITVKSRKGEGSLFAVTFYVNNGKSHELQEAGA